MPAVRPRPRILLYVQHLLGTGHIQRAATLARALAAGGFDVTLVSGGMPVPGLAIGGARLVQLPPTRAIADDFKMLVDERGRPIDDAWKAERRARLRAVFVETGPDVLITELFPFGRRQLRFELVALLEDARARPDPPLVVSSVRDILVASREPGRTAEILERIERYYDLVLVHGDPGLIPLEQTFPAARDIAARMRYTGYVVERSDPTVPPGPPEVLVSAGGGAVGEPLLAAAFAARAEGVLADCRWRFLTGHYLPEARFRGLVDAAPPGVVIERFRADFRARLRGCVLSISQGGYNTVMEVLDAGARAVVVPYSAGGETEQGLRARLLAERGVLEVVEEAVLGPSTIAAAIERAMRGPARRIDALDLTGAQTTVRILAQRLGVDLR